MAITGLSGPIIVFGQSPFPAIEYNPDLGSSLFYAGAGILDPRQPFTYLPGEAESQPDVGFLGFDNVTTLTAVPYTKAAGAIVASANPTGPNLTLVSANSATTGVYVTSSFTRSDTGVLDLGVNNAGLLVLDGFTQVTASITNGIMTVTANAAMPITPGMVITAVGGTTSSGQAVGAVVLQQLTGNATGNGTTGTYLLNISALTVTSGTISLSLPNVLACTVPYGFSTGNNPSIPLWNPQALVGRAVAVTAATGATYTTATVSGYDIYGYPMVEAITLTAGAQASGKKAFRYIRSVVLSGGTADTTHAYSVDTTDVIGLPLRSDSFGDITVNAAASLTAVTGITAATSYVASDRTFPATATTGDVRGTYAGATSATGANKLVVRQSPSPQNIGYVTGLFGQPQYSNF